MPASAGRSWVCSALPPSSWASSCSFNPYAAAHTLALLIGLTLVLGGALEIAVGWQAERRGLAILPGLVLVAGGIVWWSGPRRPCGSSPW